MLFFLLQNCMFYCLYSQKKKILSSQRLAPPSPSNVEHGARATVTEKWNAKTDLTNSRCGTAKHVVRGAHTHESTNRIHEGAQSPTRRAHMHTCSNICCQCEVSSSALWECVCVWWGAQRICGVATRCSAVMIMAMMTTANTMALVNTAMFVAVSRCYFITHICIGGMYVWLSNYALAEVWISNS